MKEINVKCLAYVAKLCPLARGEESFWVAK